MKGKKVLMILFIAAYLVVSLIPLLWMKMDRPLEGIENRILAVMPDFMTEDGVQIDYLQRLGDYFDDHFAFRQQMVTADAVLWRMLFGESARATVIAGDGDWLYFSETLDDYLGKNLLSERQLYNIAHNLSLVQEYAESRDAAFVFAVAPNKNSIYPEYMPGRYKKVSDDKNIRLLEPWLEHAGVNYTDLFAVLENDSFAGESGKILYHATDSHWNNLGAVKAYHALLDTLGHEHETYESIPYTEELIHQGDLQRMLYPRLERKTVDYVFAREFSFTYRFGKTVEDMRVVTENENASGSIVVYRDSFGNALVPFIAEAYGKALFTKAVPYNCAMIDSQSADAVILEIVERNLPNLQSNAPQMESPEREIAAEVWISYLELAAEQGEKDKDSEGEESFLTVRAETPYVRIDGAVEDIFDVDTAIYLHLVGETFEKTVEAFTVTAEDAEDSAGNPYGFTAYFRQDSLPEGDYRVEVIGYRQGTPMGALSQEIHIE